MNESRDTESRIRNSISKHHVVERQMPDDKTGFTGETRFIERPDGKHDKLRKYPEGWKKQLGGMDFINDKDGVRLEVRVGNKTYRVILQEVENG